jgi:selenocysteine-specific elongation factor
MDVSVALLPGSRPLRERARVHFHAYTSETVAEVVLRRHAEPQSSQPANTGLVGDSVAEVAGEAGQTRRELEIAPGGTAFAQLRLADPVLLLPGDRFILRQFSPVVTIGGGVVLDNAPMKVPAPEAQAFLVAIAEGTREQVLRARIERRGAQGLRLAALVAETGSLPRQVLALAEQLKKANQIVDCGGDYLAIGSFREAAEAAIRELAAFHDANRLVAGISKEELRERLGLTEPVFAAVVEALVREKKVEAEREQVRLAGRGVAMKDEETEAKQKIEQAFARSGLKVPALKEVLAALPVDKGRAQKIVTLLLRERVLVKVSEELVFHHDALEGLRQLLQAQKARSPRMDVSHFKDLAGISRKYAIPLLEWLDRERVTRRVGDERVIL